MHPRRPLFGSPFAQEGCEVDAFSRRRGSLGPVSKGRWTFDSPLPLPEASQVLRLEPLASPLQAHPHGDVRDVASGYVSIEGPPADPQQLGGLVGGEEGRQRHQSSTRRVRDGKANAQELKLTDEVEGRDSMIGNCAAEVIAAYVSNNHVALSDLPALIASVHASLTQMATGQQDASVEALEKLSPAQIRKSITPDALISFIDGKPYKVLRRHLSVYGLTPASYCQRFGLPADYPMVAPSYSERRSALARNLGLGNHGRGRAKSAA
jgi:predicted transcriptional regulator